MNDNLKRYYGLRNMSVGNVFCYYYRIKMFKMVFFSVHLVHIEKYNWTKIATQNLDILLVWCIVKYYCWHWQYVGIGILREKYGKVEYCAALLFLLLICIHIQCKKRIFVLLFIRISTKRANALQAEIFRTAPVGERILSTYVGIIRSWNKFCYNNRHLFV